MVASSWSADGGVSGYDPGSASLAIAKIHLATNAAVDVEAITRIQYPVTGFLSPGSLWGTAPLKISQEDYDAAQSAGKSITTIMCVVQAGATPAISGPTPDVGSIFLAAVGYGLVYQSPEYIPAPTLGFSSKTISVVGPDASSLSANTKYWVAVIPVMITPGASANTALPLHTSGGMGGLGRAVSIWTNRTPQAPVITSPASNSVVAAGSTVSLTIAKSDPDSIAGGDTPTYTDCAGMQVQYAPRPTPSNPNPVWTDLPFADSSGVLRKGWWIKRSNSNTAGEALESLVEGPTVPLLCGSSVPVAGKGLLPAGTWQIRARMFDFGNPFPTSTTYYPGGFSSGNYTPSNYPSTNTSGWSNAVIVNVSAQVPPPTPIWPVGNTAIAFGASVTLSWQYRNTANPPKAQASRTIQIRKVGDAAWTTVVANQASASSSYLVTGFTFVSGNAYEWRVQVKDTTGATSDYSTPSTFWIVAAPNSGGERPLPSSTIDGATLGCGKHRAFIFRRGGKRRVGEIRNISSLEWNRNRDDISTSVIRVSGWDIDCGNLLSILEPWAYEVVIFRDNGYESARVWEGPITLLTYEEDAVTIQAKDMMGYAYRRIIKQKMSDTADGDTVVSRATRVLQNVFAPDDPNVLAYLTPLTRSDDAMEYRSTPAYSRTAFEEVDDMAANAGLDYTCVGRSILLWGTKHRIGTLPEFTDNDLGNAPIVSVYGMSMANVYAVSDGNGIYGEATRLDAEGKDPTYGLVEMVSSSWASDSAPESGTYTQEGLAKVVASFEEYAERSIADRYPPPEVVRIPDNTTINPDATVSIQQLVPGVVIPLRSTGTLRNVVANQKLDALKVVEAEGKEVISITLSPFSRDDTEAGGEEE